jgi:hypothetical protein
MYNIKLKNKGAFILGLIGLVPISNIALAQSPCQSGMSVSFDLTQTQNARIKNENTYIVVLGLNPATNKHTYVKFESGNKLGTLVDINSNTINGKDFGIPLSQLTQDNSGFANACIPHITSARIYLSFGNSLDMPTDDKTLTPKQPDVNNPQTTTNGTLFDKVEFNYSTSGETVINPTGVDFFAIPYTIKQGGHEYGHLGGLEGVITNMKTIVCGALDLSPDSSACATQWEQSEWSGLIKYNEEHNLMRVDAPGRAGNSFTGYFDNYLNALSQYYSSNMNRSIKIDLSELNQGIWSGSFIPNTKTIVFKQDAGTNLKTYSYDLSLSQTSNSILMGAQAPFNNIDAIDSTIARDLTSAVVSGMLMRKESAFTGKDFFDEQGNPIFKNKQQMQNIIEFYFNNVDNSVDYSQNQCGGAGNAPCVNVYSEAMHALSSDQYIQHPQQSFLNSYAFAYDDFLGMDGTNTQTDALPAIVVIGDMKNRKIPHI